MIAMPKFFDLKSVSEELNLTLYTLRKAIADGELPSRWIGGRYYVTMEDIELFLDNRKDMKATVGRKPKNEME